MTLTLNDDLLEFYPRLSLAGQVSEVEVRGWNVKDKQEIIGQARAGAEVSKMGGQQTGAALADSAFGAAVGLLSRQPVATQAEADQLAKARFNRGVLELIEGEGACLGRTDLRAGAGDQDRRARSTFQRPVLCRLGEPWLYAPPGLSDPLHRQEERDVSFFNLLVEHGDDTAASAGVVFGVVTNNQDPDGLGRGSSSGSPG
jgi:hypothetical protein